jgi:ribosomal-protein-alanine N-acetyltransferase
VAGFVTAKKGNGRMSVGAENIPFSGEENELRLMTYADLKQIIDIEAEVYKYPWTRGIFRDCLRVGYSCWVVTIDSLVIGYGIVMLKAGEAHILNLCIKPKYQGKGLGRKMLNHLANQASTIGTDMILLEVRRSNQLAIDLYVSEGFHELGIRKAYYPSEEGREDAIILAKFLG